MRTTATSPETAAGGICRRHGVYGGPICFRCVIAPSEYKRRSNAFWFPGGYRFPNVTYSRRMPIQRLAWNLAWWLIRRVVLGWMTPQGQARQIAQALGWYRPPMQPGGLYGRFCGIRIETGAANTTSFSNVRFDPREKAK